MKKTRLYWVVYTTIGYVLYFSGLCLQKAEFLFFLGPMNVTTDFSWLRRSESSTRERLRYA